MKKLILLASIFMYGCDVVEQDIIPTKKYSLSIDSVLIQTGTKSVFKDNNGLYHIKLLPSPKQQIYRITGRVLENGKEPYPSKMVSWESNLFWWLKKGDVVANISKSYVNYYTGQFTIVQLPALSVQKTDIVPTINKTSISGIGGSINTMIAPIGNMIGDTMVVKVSNTEYNLKSFTKIVLE